MFLLFGDFLLRRFNWLLALLLVLVLIFSACGGSGPSSGTSNPPGSGGGTGGNNGGGTGGNPPPSGGGGTPGSSAHVAIVVLENTDYSDVINNPAMPWLNQLAQSNALATNYFANTHPSIGNYFMMTTGQTVTSDDGFDQVVDVDNLVRQFIADGKTWRVYADALPKAGYLGGNTGTYLKRHNPFSYFRDVVNDPAQAGNIVPFSQLSADVTAGSLPDFIFIVPDKVHDAHSCPSDNPSCSLDDRLTIADSWLNDNVAQLLTSDAFANGVLVITFDEASDQDSSHGGGKVATVIAGHNVRTSFQSSTFYQHENLLALIGDLLQLSSVPGAGHGADSMSDMHQ